jgi:transcriptional antiterminator RfaH
MTARWYAICSKPHKEEVLWRQLHAYGFEVFYPRFLTKTSLLNASKGKAYFPGYLFIKTDIDLVGISTFQWMPFATGLVCFGGKPASVPDALIEAIQKRIQRLNTPVDDFINFVSPPGPRTGQPTAVLGLQTIFDAEIPGTERVRALLKILDETNVSSKETRS